MNGGFALKLVCERNRVLDKLSSIAAEERLDLVELGPPQVQSDDGSGFRIGVGVREGETIVIPSDHGSDDAAWLEGLGEALAAHLSCPMSYVVDSDEGCELVRSWNGGEGMSPKTGWVDWDHGDHRRFALVPPGHVPVPDSEARALIPEFERSLPASVKAIGARISGLARREAHGPIGRALRSWCVGLAIRDHEPVQVVFTALPEARVVGRRVAWEVARRLDQINELATRRVANPKLRDAVAARIAVALESLERAGFGNVTWYAIVALDGEPVTLECETYEPGESAEEEFEELVEQISTAIAAERQQRDTAASEALDVILQAQIVRGELDAAAATYRKLHAVYFASLDEERAIAMAQAKVRELVKLYVR